MQPVFSVVIPVYKTEKFLDACVSSVINQTFQNIEILLVDDGSPDRCPEMCDGYTDPRIRVIHKENGGLSDARNAGIRAASGEYILFLDSDDYLEPNACEMLLPAAKTGSDILVGRWIRDGEPMPDTDTAFLRVWEPAAYVKSVLAAGHMRMAAVLYIQRRAFLLEKGLLFKRGIRHEDDHFTPRALLTAEHLTETKVAFYRYILREDSITTQKDLRQNARDLESTCRELRTVYDSMKDRKLAKLLSDLLAVQMLSLCQQGKLFQYGRDYTYRRLIWKNAARPKTRLKTLLYCLSPRLYWKINHFIKTR